MGVRRDKLRTSSLRRELGVKLLGFCVGGVFAQKRFKVLLCFVFAADRLEAGGKGVADGFVAVLGEGRFQRGNNLCEAPKEMADL